MYLRNLVDPLFKREGYKTKDNDQPLDVYLRKLAVSWACAMENPECIEKTKGNFGEWMNDLNPDDSNP